MSDGFGAFLFYVVVIGVLLIGSWQCNVAGCKNACKLEGASYEYVIGSGCYCTRDGEAWNPRDAR